MRLELNLAPKGRRRASRSSKTRPSFTWPSPQVAIKRRLTGEEKHLKRKKLIASTKNSLLLLANTIGVLFLSSASFLGLFLATIARWILLDQARLDLRENQRTLEPNKQARNERTNEQAAFSGNGAAKSRAESASKKREKQWKSNGSKMISI